MPSEYMTTPSPLLPSRDHSVATTIVFASPLPTAQPGEKWFVDINDQRNNNYKLESIPTNVYDMRGQEENTHIDTTGFQALTEPSFVSADLLLSGNDKEIEKIYYPEVEALLLKYTGM
jgi:hypothetical protein